MKRSAAASAVFVTAFCTVLLEILLTRVFSVLYLGHFAFLIISLAMLGYGVGGVWLSLRPPADTGRAVARRILGFAVLLVPVYKLCLTLRVDFLHLFSTPLHLVWLTLDLAAVGLLFFLAGSALAMLFAAAPAAIGRLYGLDLIGAGLGALAAVPFVPWLGPERALLLMVLALFAVWAPLSPAPLRRRAASLVGAALLAALAWPHTAALFPLEPGITKRLYNRQLRAGRIEYSGWSTINKIDVAPSPFPPPQKLIWINGGTKQSSIHRWSAQETKVIEWDLASLPYQLAGRGAAVIIGAAGGWEAVCAVSHGFSPVVAIEMDPLICRLMRTRYADYSGGIFRHPAVTLLNDEGRSALQRMERGFDVIQMVNSHNTDTLLAGGGSISETYIYTVESFREYWRKLRPDGYLYIVHWLGERLFTTGLEALRGLGVPGAERRFFVLQAPQGFTYFFMKKGEYTARDREILRRFAALKGLEVAYDPLQGGLGLYPRLATADNRAAVAASAVSIGPVHDISPYFNQTNRIGQWRFADMEVLGMARQVVENGIRYSNAVYFGILAVSLLLAALFLFLPLRRFPPAGLRDIAFFFLIGLAFIMVEIVVIKILQLFLGSPDLSVALTICVLLVSSGTGSMLAGRPAWRRCGWAWPAVSLAALLGAAAFFLFPLLRRFIHLPFTGRLALAALLIVPAGLLMGMFFPRGIAAMGREAPARLGWAWGANAFATVLGSILAVIGAINWDFRVVLLAAACAYLAAACTAPRVRV